MKLTKVSQSEPLSPEPMQASQYPKARNNSAIANALVESARSLGLDAHAAQTSGNGLFSEWMVSCNGRKRVAQATGNSTHDIQIIYNIPATGDMTGRVMSGMENGPADHVMRTIVAGAVRATGMAAQQIERTVNPELCMNPRAFTDHTAQTSTMTPQTNIPGGPQNGMA